MYLTVLALYIFLFSVAQAVTPLKAKVGARAAVLINAENGAVLYDKDAYVPTYPASTTKIITALYALEKRGDALDTMVLASPEAMHIVPPSVRRSSHPPYRLEFGGTHMKLRAGEILPFKTLLYGLMLCSGNDAANVIAEFVSGSIPKFVEELNQFVREKGCRSAVLHTPHGLACPDHKITPYEMALFTKEALKNPLFCEIVRTLEHVRPETNKQPQGRLTQFNALLRPGPFFYSKALGVKTGYTDDAGFTLVAAADNGQRKVISVVFGAERNEQRYVDTVALFEAAFNEPKVTRTLFSNGFDLFSAPVEGGKSAVKAHLAADVAVAFYPSEEPLLHSRVDWQFPPLPIHKGQQVGSLKIESDQGQLWASAPLFAATQVDPTLKHRCHRLLVQLRQVHFPWVVGSFGVLLLFFTFYRFRPAPAKS